ncbi:MAG: enoyl-CoA hydratase/isomerase family protein [Deltaproteobacteria bacterium]|nr:enoyl-CoA hydratase/isomerase family protein [Deltaproteobacteria bacterium]
MGLLYERKDRIAFITLNRPGAMNALDRATVLELSESWADFRDDPQLRVLVVTGAGDKAFCAGGDVREWVAAGQDPHAAGWLDGLVTPMRMTDLYKPVIAAINGHCLGGGLELALACDLRLASTWARFGQPEIKLGIFPGQGATQRLPRLLPYNLAAELLFTGEIIDAQEAWRIGLVNRLAEPQELMNQARALAQELADKPPLALQAAKEALLKSYDLPFEEGLSHEGRLRKKIGRSRDAAEGRAAFIDKREPVFKGE